MRPVSRKTGGRARPVSVTHYYSQDGLGSVRTLTDSSGTTINKYDYSAFGEAYAAGTAAAVSQRYTYTGRELNPVSGTHQMRYRVYQPNLGRLLVRDPIYYMGGINLYTYALNSPTVRTDPFALLDLPDPFSRAIRDAIDRAIEEAKEKAAQAAAAAIEEAKRRAIDAAMSALGAFGGFGEAAIEKAKQVTKQACDLAGDLSSTDEFVCLCGVAGAADIPFSDPAVETADCVCNVITTLDLLCKEEWAKAGGYAGLTAADCASTAIGKTLGAIVGGLVGGGGGDAAAGPPGVPLGGGGGAATGAAIGDVLTDTAAAAAQNYITQGTPLPEAQEAACCRILEGK
jgi:RHS repeat-associated protein